MMGRKDFKKETMAKRARSRVMDDKMSKMMMSPRKMMSMGKSPGPGMGADSAPMAMKKGGAVTKGSIMGTGKTKASAKSDYMKKMKAAGFADGGMVGASNADKPKRLSTTTGITAEQYQQAKAQNTDIGQMSPEQRAQRRATMGAQRDQARQQKMDRFKTFATNRPTAEPVKASITNPMARKVAEAAAMRKVQTEIRQAKRAGVDVQSARNAQRAPGTQTQPGPGATRVKQAPGKDILPGGSFGGPGGSPRPGAFTDATAATQKTAAFKKGGAVKKYAVGGEVNAGPMPTPMPISQSQFAQGQSPMRGGPGLQRQPGPMPMQPGGMQNMSAGQQKVAMMKQQAQPMRQKADQLRQMMDERRTAKQQGQPAPRGGMSLAQQLNGKSALPPGMGMGQASPNNAAMAQQLMQQGKMQQAGTPGMGSQSAAPAFKKGGMVKKPASKNPMPMGPKGGKAGMMLIIGFGKKGKK